MRARRRAQRERAAARCGSLEVGGVGVSGSVGIARLAFCEAVRAAGCCGVAAELDHALARESVRCENALVVVAVAVDAGRRDQAAQRGEELERREGEDGAAVAGGPRRELEDPADAGLAA
jgi:hypothetical protein